MPELSAPTPPRTAQVRPDNVVHFSQNRYAVPRGSYSPGRNARIEADEEKGTVTFYDAVTGEPLAFHPICYGKGHYVPLPRNADRFRGNQYEALKSKVLEGFAGMTGAQEYIEAIAKKYPRYFRDQLSILKKAQETYTKPELGQALDYCTRRDLISANDFRDTLVYFRQTGPSIPLRAVTLPVQYSVVRAEIRSVEVYSLACRGAKGGDSL